MRQTFSRLARSCAAGFLALLFVGGGAPALANDCILLLESDNVWFTPVPEASRKPANVTVSLMNAAGTGFNIDWDIPSDFPTSVLRGHCVEQTHPVKGRHEENCLRSNQTHAIESICFRGGGIYCYGGTHRFRVRLTTNCDVTLPWSDAVEITTPYGG